MDISERLRATRGQVRLLDVMIMDVDDSVGNILDEKVAALRGEMLGKGPDDPQVKALIQEIHELVDAVNEANAIKLNLQTRRTILGFEAEAFYQETLR